MALALSNNCEPKPMLLKMAPDLTWSEIDKLLEVASEQSINGIIATNTTLRRKGLESSIQSQNGGLSGSPLFERSLEVISYVAKQLSGSLAVIGVGGVSSAADVAAMLAAGASLVQIYTGLVYQGPQLAGRILRTL
jgi:dihydroorotate dehydrogenase